jgi:ABC-2 type transport system ATP-binding protein
MSVQALLRFAAEAKDVPRRRRRPEAERVIESCGLQDVRRRLIGHLSKGFRQRVGIAQALIHEPAVLILDEPTIGLDPEQVVEIRHLIRQLGKERTVILSTHILSEVSSICNRIIVIHRGRVLTSEPISALQARLERTRRVRVEVDGPAEETRAALSQLSGVVRVDSTESPRRVLGEGVEDTGVPAVSFVLEYQGKDIGRELSRMVFAHGWGLSEMHRVEPTLEDLYLKLVHESGEQAGQERGLDVI